MFCITFIFLFILRNIFVTKGSELTNYKTKEKILFDFTKDVTTDDWIEQSDSVREVGMSKAVMTMQKTRVFNRAVFFTLLNPQPNGACFAGVRYLTELDLELYNFISMKIRGQGQNKYYKVILRHNHLNDEPNPTYEQYFTAPMNKFSVVDLNLSDFKPYYRGKELNNTEPLDKTQVTSIGLQIYGGVYLPMKQSGASSLEIEWIKATA